MEDNIEYELPSKLEKIFALLSVIYAKKGRPELQSLLVNSHYSVDEAVNYDNWDGGQYGHVLHLYVHPDVYYPLFDDLEVIARELNSDINRVANCPQESISFVYLELQDDPSIINWREDSGMLLQSVRVARAKYREELDRLWLPGHLRVFLSHKSEHKVQATNLKEALGHGGVSCFVAHEDIETTKEWQDEIEKALFSMDIMVALLTKGFHGNLWTDQEIGVALGRDIPVVAVRLGTDPSGFIGKYQGLAGIGKDPCQLGIALFELIHTKIPRLKERAIDSLLGRFESAASYIDAFRVFEYIELIKEASPEVLGRLENAFENNPQIHGCIKVKNRWPNLLKRLKGAE